MLSRYRQRADRRAIHDYSGQMGTAVCLRDVWPHVVRRVTRRARRFDTGLTRFSAHRQSGAMTELTVPAIGTNDAMHEVCDSSAAEQFSAETTVTEMPASPALRPLGA